MNLFLKKVFLILLVIFNIFLFYGCTEKKEEKISESKNNEKRENISEENKNLKGVAISPFTGLYIDENIAKKRPIAVTINNLHKALPQSGISQADMYYENLAEGEITRIIAIFQNHNSKKIGPVRSTREYFSYYPLDTDAIYVHHGGSAGGYQALKDRKVDSIDGMTDTTAFYRDQKRANTPGMYEHSSYISSDGLNKSIENNGYRTQYKGTPLFRFYDENNIVKGGTNAKQISVPYSYYQNSEFIYDSESNLYERHQGGKPQVDQETGETIKVSNIIVQFADTYVVDEDGRRGINLVGSGKGQAFYGGEIYNINWSKSNYRTQTQWYNENGERLTLNPGKTWICVVPLDMELFIIPDESLKGV